MLALAIMRLTCAQSCGHRAAVTPVDLFAWVDWQGVRRDGADRPGTVVALRRTAAASTVNRRVAAVRAFFEYLVMTGAAPAIRCHHPGAVRASARQLAGCSITWGQAARAVAAGWSGSHREASGAVRVRPHRLRHTYGTEL